MIRASSSQKLLIKPVDPYSAASSSMSESEQRKDRRCTLVIAEAEVIVVQFPLLLGIHGPVDLSFTILHHENLL